MSETPEMVERVARALCAATPNRPGSVEEHFSDEQPDAREHWMTQARAAIEAMRDPTEKMIDAALNVDWGCEGDERGGAVNVWHTMSAAALSPPTSTA